ncbi:MAG: hemerythrin family protein [Magnetospirillum sp.]|nr:hemerythrin family protein [Magnetospirillum sp.]
MAALEWHEGRNVGIGFMDHDHAETAALINAVAEAGPDQLPETFRRFLAHTEAHFAREETMMREVGFFAYGPHKGEHDRVLEDLRATAKTLETGTAMDSRAMAHDLADWLIGHRDSMDMVTANFARANGRR